MNSVTIKDGDRNQGISIDDKKLRILRVLKRRKDESDGHGWSQMNASRIKREIDDINPKKPSDASDYKDHLFWLNKKGLVIKHDSSNKNKWEISSKGEKLLRLVSSPSTGD